MYKRQTPYLFKFRVSEETVPVKTGQSSGFRGDSSGAVSDSKQPLIAGSASVKERQRRPPERAYRQRDRKVNTEANTRVERGGRHSALVVAPPLSQSSLNRQKVELFHTRVGHRKYVRDA